MKVTKDELSLLQACAEREAEATDADLERWSGVLSKLSAARLFKAPAQGRRPVISDDELIATYHRVGSLRATLKALDYTDHYWVSKRLQALGVEIRKGRPRKTHPP